MSCEVSEAKHREAKIMKKKGIDEEYAKEWWIKTEPMINDKVACNLDIQTMVLEILGKNYVPVKSKHYTLLTDIKKFVEDRLNEDGISVKIKLKKLKEIMKTLGFNPAEGCANKVWLIQYYPNSLYRVGWWSFD